MTKTPECPQIDEKKVGSLYSKTDLLKVIAEYLNDALPRVGYHEDHFWTNIRIILCIVCCSFGLYAQFGAKFPQDRIIMGCCVAGYFLFTGILSVIDYLVIQQSLICIKIGEQPVFIDVALPSYSPEMHITLRTWNKTVTHQTEVSKYYDWEGFLNQENFFADLMMLFKKFEKEGTGKAKEKAT